VPIHNYFNTFSIEIVNQLNKGIFYESLQDVVLARYDIRVPDIKDLFRGSRTDNNSIF